MNFIEVTLFVLALLACMIILVLGLCTVLIKKFNFWPPPALCSWQKKVSWILFRFMSYPLFAMIFLNLNTVDWRNIFTVSGGMIFLFSLILSIRISIKLGIKNSYGGSQGLVTDGWYSISRNPIYFFTIIALLGLIVFMPKFEIIIVSFLWILIYLLIPYLEEPWLENLYEKRYLEYKKRVRRFI